MLSHRATLTVECGGEGQPVVKVKVTTCGSAMTELLVSSIMVENRILFSIYVEDDLKNLYVKNFKSLY